MSLRRMIFGFHEVACLCCLVWAVVQIFSLTYLVDSIGCFWVVSFLSGAITIGLWFMFPAYLDSKEMLAANAHFYRFLQLASFVFFLNFLMSSVLAIELKSWGRYAQATYVCSSLFSFIVVLATYRGYGGCIYTYMSRGGGDARS